MSLVIQKKYSNRWKGKQTDRKTLSLPDTDSEHVEQLASLYPADEHDASDDAEGVER